MASMAARVSGEMPVPSVGFAFSVSTAVLERRGIFSIRAGSARARWRQQVPDPPSAGVPRILPRVDRHIAIERRYEIQACAARGAFGEVLCAVDRVTGEKVAIKRLHEHLVTAE